MEMVNGAWDELLTYLELETAEIQRLRTELLRLRELVAALEREEGEDA